MPASDVRVHANKSPVPFMLEGLAVRNDTLFTDENGEENAGVKKRSTQAIEKLAPALRKILRSGETVLYIMPGRSPLTAIEQITIGYWAAILAACAIVVTNSRILFIPVKVNRTWRESVRAVNWGDMAEVQKKGPFGAMVTFRFRNGEKATYAQIRRQDAKKLSAIATALIPASAGEQTAVQGPVQLCPDCRGVLTAKQYLCPACGLTFKNEKKMVLLSIFLPGGGYFYTGHPVLGSLIAVAEGLLLLQLLALVLVPNSNAAPTDFSATLTILAIVWVLETAITIMHCRRLVREFIPLKRDPTRAMQGASIPKIG